MADDAKAPAPTNTTPTDAKVPRFTKFANNISALTERTRTAREELEKMLAVTSELKEQCSLQEKETSALEKEQALAVTEVESLKKRIEVLASEKQKIEAKLEDLRNENSRLDQFVKQHEGPVPAAK
ncbi:hypothetical protein BDR26DRAFT_855516 [Obelidium mucronatum]|nr:hypothetical protein BDR26DRAFT_855516 [Obelidium mucronatum]